MAMAATIEDLHEDVLALVLRRLDGPSLAAASCASARLRGLSGDPAIWRDLCLATWPSLRLLPLPTSPPQSLFSDAFPFPRCRAQAQAQGQSPPRGVPPRPLRGLISAVDLYHRGAPVFSRVLETRAASPWFLGSPFRIDALDPKHEAPSAAAISISPGELTLSWIVIDPARGRAVNLSSRRPVRVDRHWFTGETLVRFATVVREFSVTAAVTCGEGEDPVREVSLVVEDADGIGVSGGESLGIIGEALEGARRGRGRGEEEANRRYDEFMRRRKRRKESKARREGLVDFLCTAVGAAVSLAFLLLVALG
ncbi:putative F-box protein [Ananas comosus]|uniref:Putative F-box protein n=1 Tax=Ananas comosus TaxID=4615 RepID=A0A199UN62_ANACO|nr:putative F-box protein [Ananas comosus]